MYLDLETQECHLECPETLISIQTAELEQYNGQVFNYCRDPTQYYVDNLSKESIELGTQKYPFKQIDDPFREIFNNAYQQEYNITINVKTNSPLYIFASNMPLVMLNQNFTITTYQGNNPMDWEEIMEKTKIDNDGQMPANFFIQIEESIPIPYNYEKMNSLGLMSDNEVVNVKDMFYVLNSTLLLSNLAFGDAITLSNDGFEKALIYNPNSQKWVNVTNCYFGIKERFMFTLTGFNFHVRDSYFDQTYLVTTYLTSYSLNCSNIEETYEQSLIQIFENNTFFGFNNNQQTNLYFDNVFGYVHIINNKFYGNQISSSSSPIYFYYSDACEKDHAEKRILFKDNIIDYGSLPYYENNLIQIEYIKSGYANLTVEITGNIFQNTIYGVYGWSYIDLKDRTDKMKVIITNNTFKNVTNHRPIHRGLKTIYWNID
ncbi:UNKNOWN [Stylonychia lemnae]|uniref:Uncharacterized protein n=1 Tax=Stylonychia lemnae TaxID=5949 RepID=A0A078AGG4_STYLE|nr:UNKNOWN [Stylonychia lemnae]|eukprot:CDW80901.1 UNKNOWN [Stylonychia lemnae]